MGPPMLTLSIGGGEMPTTDMCNVVVPAREGRAVILAAGDRLRIIDVEGSQVGDVFAFAAADTGEYLSSSHTRAHSSRLFPRVGEVFVSNYRRPMLAFVDDSSPGTHDMLMAACDPARYAALGHPGHPSCVGNLHACLASVELSVTDAPQAVNLFMNIPVAPDGTLSWLPAASSPGDSVTFEALRPCVVVVSACPQDLIPLNGAGPTPLAIDVTRAR